MLRCNVVGIGFCKSLITPHRVGRSVSSALKVPYIVSMKTSRFIAKVVGLGGILFILIALVSGGSLLERMNESMSDPGFILHLGIMTLFIGLAIVLGHNVWDGSWRVLITVVGYLALLKGIVLLAWPNVMVEISQYLVESGMIWLQLIIGFAFYSWLTWLGFRPKSKESEI